MVFINKAYAEQDVNEDTTMFDLFLSSFWLGEGTRSLVDHLLVVAVDQPAYDRCQFLRLNCFKLETVNGDDFANEQLFMSPDFIKMMWRRTLFLLQVLKRGYSFIFTVSFVSFWFGFNRCYICGLYIFVVIIMNKIHQFLTSVIL